MWSNVVSGSSPLKHPLLSTTRLAGPLLPNNSNQRASTTKTARMATVAAPAESVRVSIWSASAARGRVTETARFSWQLQVLYPSTYSTNTLLAQSARRHAFMRLYSVCRVRRAHGIPHEPIPTVRGLCHSSMN